MQNDPAALSRRRRMTPGQELRGRRPAPAESYRGAPSRGSASLVLRARQRTLPGPARRQAPFLATLLVTARLPWSARTGMRLACTSLALGTRTSRTPSRAEASILSAWTWLGRVIDRGNAA